MIFLELCFEDLWLSSTDAASKLLSQNRYSIFSLEKLNSVIFIRLDVMNDIKHVKKDVNTNLKNTRKLLTLKIINLLMSVCVANYILLYCIQEFEQIKDQAELHVIYCTLIILNKNYDFVWYGLNYIKKY